MSVKRIIYLENMSAWGKLFLLLGLIILSSLFSALTGLLIGKLFFGIDLAGLSDFISNPQTPDAVAFVKIYQLINQIGIFIIPVIIYSLLVSPSVGSYLNLDKRPGLLSLLISGLIVYTILPFNHYLLEINQSINLPEAFSAIENWINDYETRAEALTRTFLETNSLVVLMVNIFIVAVVPAIGEEWLFRGVLLKLFKQITSNVHWAVIITAILFSALHLQFVSFLPRFALGILLGYLFVATHNLWIPIFAHFVNNTSSAIIYYLHYNGKIKIPLEQFGSSTNTVYIIGSLLITVWLMFMIFGKERSRFTT